LSSPCIYPTLRYRLEHELGLQESVADSSGNGLPPLEHVLTALIEVEGESLESYYSSFYNMINEMIRNKLKVDTLQVNVQFLLQIQLEWSRFVIIVIQAMDLDIISYHKLFDILKQHHNKVKELRAKRIARTANPLALVATTKAKPGYHSQSQPTYHQQAPLLSIEPRQTTSSKTYFDLRSKGKKIVRAPSPTSKSDSEYVSDLENTHENKDIQHALALISNTFKNIYIPTNNNLRTSSKTQYRNSHLKLAFHVLRYLKSSPATVNKSKEPYDDKRDNNSVDSDGITNYDDIHEPKTFVEVVKDSRWVEVMNQEMDDLNRNKTWEVIDLPKDRKAIGCKWIFEVEYKSSEEVERFKARLVVKVNKSKEPYDDKRDNNSVDSDGITNYDDVLSDASPTTPSHIEDVITKS
nr:putative reverse transcriptase, RNA-dependent DNA polymerase, Gag-polypeptide of LTR copia-type [Tanacetum cinerariifolium]